MKVGDKVKVVDEGGIFLVKKIEGNKFILVDEYGFENSYVLKEIIPYIPLDHFAIDTKGSNKDEGKSIIQSGAKKAAPREEIREIDLHIGHLVDSMVNMQPHQMLSKQLYTARLEIDKARRDGVKKLILIHGKGKGVLKGELYKLLESVNGIEYWEADIVKYRFGAVEIRFK